MAEKDAQIEELSAQLGAIEEQIAKGELAPPPPVPKTRTELEEWGDELEKESAKLQQERKRLDAERQQFREDEEALEKQMRRDGGVDGPRAGDDRPPGDRTAPARAPRSSTNWT